MRSTCSVVISLLLVACGRGTATSTNPDLATALVHAGEGGKVVFVDFGAEWCAPCKQLASTTLANPTVVAWLRDHTIALTVDIDASPALAKEFRIQSVPTMVFLRPDRSELGRITGYVDAAEFVRVAEERLRGITAVDSAREATLATPKDCGKKLALMRDLRGAGQLADALLVAEDYWQASRKDMSQGGVRVTFFLAEMARLAGDYAPAKARMGGWITTASEQLLAGRHLMLAAQELAALSRETHAPQVVLDTADALAAKGDDAKRALRALATAATKELVADRRYTMVVESGACEPKAVTGRFAMLQGLASQKRDQAPDTARSMLRLVAEDVVPAFEALVGVGRTEDALAIAAVALANADADLRTVFVRAAERAGHAEIRDRLRDVR